MAIFPTRKEEPRQLRPYEDLLQSERVNRIYLEDFTKIKNPPVGLGILQLLLASESEAQKLVPRILEKAKTELTDSELTAKVVELVQGVLFSKFTDYDREGMRMKFKLHDIRESKVWKEAEQEGEQRGEQKGIAKGIEKGEAQKLRQILNTLLAKHKTIEEISGLLDIPVEELRKVADTSPTK